MSSTTVNRAPLDIHPKVAAAAAVGIIVTAIIEIVGVWVTIPTEIVSAATVISSLIASYLTPGDEPVVVAAPTPAPPTPSYYPPPAA